MIDQAFADRLATLARRADECPPYSTAKRLALEDIADAFHEAGMPEIAQMWREAAQSVYAGGTTT